ncbi:unannotated protein [freshwater metagenome]|uniref:Unannotated protein n=1 Tax=freshwater metagenome TaxID=449393 RepID=A0A6J6L4B5_9ZZZZ
MSAKRVKKVASSTALSPPPTTAIVCPLKKKPSQVAHQETPRPDKRFSFSKPISRYALPVARITDLALTVFPEPSLRILMSPVKSISTMSSVTISVPNRLACFRILSIRSGPITPSVNPGKFSTSVVFMSAPPAVTDPSYINGSNWARDAYIAAVYPAGPEPTMTTFLTSLTLTP